MRIDMHTHIIPPEWPDWRAQFGSGAWPRLEPHNDGTASMFMGDKLFMRLDHRFWSVSPRLTDMDRFLVDMQVLSPIPAMACYWANAAANQVVARFLNEHIASVVAEHPDRFIGMATVPLQDPERAIEEIRHARESLGIRAVQIGTCPAGRELDDPLLSPFFQACQDLSVSIFVHPIMPILGRERMDRYYLPNIVGNPMESTLAISRLIFGGVLDRFPKLKFCFAHAGGTFSFILGRVMKGYEVRPETRGLLSRPPSEYARRIYVDSLTFDAASLHLVIEKHGVERILMGSDYPFSLGDTNPVASIKEAKLDEQTEDLVWDKNVREFFSF